MFSFFKPFIFKLDPEMAHDLAIKSLKYNFIPEDVFKVSDEHLLETKLFDKTLKNPIGLAAGFDKSAEVYNSLFKLGFGFVEVGTITPKQQFGNLKPRIFRLEKDKALINRLGFNNDGLRIVSERLRKNLPSGILGINIGPNKNTKSRIDDYLICLEGLYNYSDYITINISSPNTPGLREFHEEKYLNKLLSEIDLFLKKNKITKPVVIKISPDIEDKEISYIIELLKKFKIKGIIISNTTDSHRKNLISKHKKEEGGLSGEPISQISNILIKKFYREIQKEIIIIGVGGVNSGQSAFDKLKSGASLFQLYTGMIYEGPGVVKKIKKELIDIFKKENIKNLNEVIGAGT